MTNTTPTITDPVAAENHLAVCPVCRDTMNAHISNSVPTWSDNLDEVVCHWCANHAAAVTRATARAGKPIPLNKLNEGVDPQTLAKFYSANL